MTTKSFFITALFIIYVINYNFSQIPPIFVKNKSIEYTQYPQCGACWSCEQMGNCVTTNLNNTFSCDYDKGRTNEYECPNCLQRNPIDHNRSFTIGENGCFITCWAIILNQYFQLGKKIDNECSAIGKQGILHCTDIPEKAITPYTINEWLINGKTVSGSYYNIN